MSDHVGWALIGLGVAAAAFVLDRALRWAEDRDWIYYRTRKISITSVASALFQMQALVQPEKQHIIEAKRETKEDEDDDGDGKPPPTVTLPEPQHQARRGREERGERELPPPLKLPPP